MLLNCFAELVVTKFKRVLNYSAGVISVIENFRIKLLPEKLTNKFSILGDEEKLGREALDGK